MKRASLCLALMTLAALPAAAAGICGNGVVDAGEDCDDGGYCIGGGNAGAACTAEGDCEGDGACFGGFQDLRGCRSDQDCPEGRCIHCRPVGGDACASNCRFESDMPATLLGPPDDPPICTSLPAPGDPIFCGFSGATINGPFLDIPLPFRNARETFIIGRRTNGVLPATVRAEGFALDAVPIARIACACIRPVIAMTCGGTRSDADGNESPNCTPGFDGIEPCPASRACAPLFGPGNIASGFIRCGGPHYDIDVTRDCGSMPGRPPFDPWESVRPNDHVLKPTDGAAFISQAWAIGTVVGGCTGTSPDYGPDGVFCTDDDPISSRGAPAVQTLTTGTATGTVIDDTFESGSAAAFEQGFSPFATGAPFVCAGDGLGPSAETTLVSAAVLCDQPTVSDIVLITQLALETAGSTPCAGDCNGDRNATVDELTLIVNIGIGDAAMTSCTAADMDVDGRATVDELVLAVNSALEGCP